MVISALAALAILTPRWNLHGPSQQHGRVGAWTYRVHADSFTARKNCNLSRKGVTFARQTLTFHLSARTDTAEAMYKIDGGPALSWRANAMELAADGVRLDEDDLANPSRGAVNIPARALDGARVVLIRATAGSRPVRFPIDGFAKALATAEAAGCAPDGFY